MSQPPRQAGPPHARRRWLRRLLWCGALPLVVIALLVLLLLVVLPPERVVPMVLARLGDSLGLEISAEGDPASRLGRHPSFAVRNVVAREPGAGRPLLEARRIVVAVPWATLRGLGEPLALVRVELDAPIIDLPALQHWLATRPPGQGRLPSLGEGLRIRDGRLNADGWRIEALQLALPRLHPEAPLRAQARGEYTDDVTHAPFNLAATLMRPRSGGGFGLAGTVAPARDDWRLPAWILLSGGLHWNETVQLLPARFGASARYLSGESALPFSLGLHGPLRFQGAALTLVPAGVSLRGQGLVPALAARGRLAHGSRLVLDLDGHMAHWPDAWPALPPPLGASRDPLGLSLAYAGPVTLDAPLQLQLTRDDLRFAGQLVVPALIDWTQNPDGSPLPPLRGRLEAPAMEISGARLEGIALEFDDDVAEGPAP